MRKKEEVVRTEPFDSKELAQPYDPKVFPDGNWVVTAVVAKDAKDTYLHPYFIATTARQEVDLWNTIDEKYTTPSGKKQMDAGYGIHFSSSNTTLGCIRIANKQDLLDLVAAVQKAFSKGEIVEFIVKI